MKWHNFTSCTSQLQMETDEAIWAITNAEEKVVPTAVKKNAIAGVQAEAKWVAARRPYYILYPSIVEAFLKVDLDKVFCQHLALPIPQLVIRLPEGESCTKVQTIFVFNSVSHGNSKNPALGLVMDDGSVGRDGILNSTFTGLTLFEGMSIQERLDYGQNHPYVDDVIDHINVQDAFKIVATICLLRGNPELIEPEPLAADKAKWEATHDPALLEKAARRGKVEFSVGKRIEVTAGFRHPHFAIRWMGHRPNLEPILRPVKGCIVNRDKIMKVPTGYLDLEESYD